jgi:hypothetical protein
MNSIAPSRFLKRALLADAAVSGAVAVLQLVAASLLAAETGLPGALLKGTGLFLIAYVALLITLATRQRLWPALIWFVIIGNVGWAIAAIAVTQTLPLSTLGHAFAAVHAVAVTVFAGLEYRGLAPRESAPRHASLGA